MDTTGTTYELSASKFEEALSILNREKKASILSLRQKRIYNLLKISIISYFITIIAYGATIFNEETILTALVGFSMVASFLLTIIAFFLSLPFIIKLKRQLKLVKQLGLNRILQSIWKKEKSKTRFRNALSLILAFWGVLNIIGGIIYLALGVYFAITESSPLPASHLIWLGLGIFNIILGIAFISVHLIRRYKRRLEVINRLKESLDQYKVSSGKTKGEEIGVAREDYELIAKIERAQIIRDQAESILADDIETDESYFSIQKSSVFREKMTKLDNNVKMVVEDQIDDIVTKAKAMDSITERAENVHNIRLEDAPYEINYQIDKDNNKIKLVSLERSTKD